jgi:hypothetical protein
MRVQTNVFARPRALCACALLCLAAGVAAAQQPQQTPQQPAAQPQIKLSSEAEMKAVQAVQSAADGAAALAAAGELLKKYPKTPARAEAALVVADKIAQTADPTQRVTLSENFLKVFNAPEEANIINSVLALAYHAAGRLDDAFRVAEPAAVGNFANPYAVLITLTSAGTEQLQKGNTKYVQQSRQLGLKAVEMLEADQVPAGADAARWGAYKAEQLPVLYNSLAVMSYAAGDKADARQKLEKLAGMNLADAFTYYVLGRMADEDYQALATKYKSASGAEQAELQKQALAQMDKVIDFYARAIALAEGVARYEQLRTGLRADVETYYKYRHNNSTDGLQALIDKYKKPAR